MQSRSLKVGEIFQAVTKSRSLQMRASTAHALLGCGAIPGDSLAVPVSGQINVAFSPESPERPPQPRPTFQPLRHQPCMGPGELRSLQTQSHCISSVSFCFGRKTSQAFCGEDRATTNLFYYVVSFRFSALLGTLLVQHGKQMSPQLCTFCG